MKLKMLGSVVFPLVKWTIKEVMQNPFLLEYAKARASGVSKKEAYDRAAFRVNKEPVCPTCGAEKVEDVLRAA